MTRNLANTLGPERIRCPAQCRLDLDRQRGRDAATRRRPEAGLAEPCATPPRPDRPKIMQPEEIAAHTAFWLSDDSAPVSGQIYEAEQFPIIGRG